MRRGRRARGGTPRRVALAAVLTVAAACTSGGGDGGTPKPTFAIVFMGALTGDLAPLVIGSSRGAELAVEQANAARDLPAVLRFEAQDTRAHPDRASTLAGRVAEDPDVIGVVGPANSGESYLAGTILDGAGVPFVTPSATDPGLSRQGWTHWFRAVGNNLSQGAPAGRLLAARAARGAFVAHDRTADGLALARGAGRELRRAGRLAGFAGITPGQPSYGGLVRRVRASGADAFFWGGFAPEAVVLVRGLRRAGFRGDFLITGEARNDVFLAAGRAARGALAT